MHILERTILKVVQYHTPQMAGFNDPFSHQLLLVPLNTTARTASRVRPPSNHFPLLPFLLRILPFYQATREVGHLVRTRSRRTRRSTSSGTYSHSHLKTQLTANPPPSQRHSSSAPTPSTDASPPPKANASSSDPETQPSNCSKRSCSGRSRPPSRRPPWP